MARAEAQAVPEQDHTELLKQVQAALAARKPQTQSSAFNPDEQQQFARFGLDPQRLRFMGALAKFRRGMNLEKELISRALKGVETPTLSSGSEREEELAQFA